VFLAESRRLEAWLAEKGLTAAEACRRRLKVPGNTFMTPKLRVEMDRRRPEFEAKQKAEQARRDAEYEALMARSTQQGDAACTSNTETLPT